MDLISSRNSVADSLVDTPLSSSPASMRTATTVSMEHAVPELRITPEVSHNILFCIKFFLYFII